MKHLLEGDKLLLTLKAVFVQGTSLQQAAEDMQELAYDDLGTSGWFKIRRLESNADELEEATIDLLIHLEDITAEEELSCIEDEWKDYVSNSEICISLTTTEVDTKVSLHREL